MLAIRESSRIDGGLAMAAAKLSDEAFSAILEAHPSPTSTFAQRFYDGIGLRARGKSLILLERTRAKPADFQNSD
jgi:hypothetical protein